MLNLSQQNNVGITYKYLLKSKYWEDSRKIKEENENGV
jgi:hypothetical protein